MKTNKNNNGGFSKDFDKVADYHPGNFIEFKATGFIEGINSDPKSGNFHTLKVRVKNTMYIKEEKAFKVDYVTNFFSFMGDLIDKNGRALKLEETYNFYGSIYSKKIESKKAINALDDSPFQYYTTTFKVLQLEKAY